ncbi:MAG: thioredoxin-disulfide reductase [Clostridiales bacterium]|jgi:thioredoxin reductase (NADPH)|nr:thioredoxin-disulfide reductase [Clostridiales bacterium]
MYDVIILGGGAAGLTAALYARRYGLSALLIEELYLGGQIINTHEIENYPGFAAPISGGELIDEFEKQMRIYKPDIIYSTVTGVELAGDVKVIKTVKQSYESRCIIAATGRNPRELGLAREKKLRGSGVSYCATCDGNFFRGKEIAIVGGGDTAVTEALFLSRICRKVYIIHRRDSFRAARAETAKLKTAGNIESIMNARITELLGEDKVEGVVLSEAGHSPRTLELSAVFVAVGAVPNSKMFEGMLTLDEHGYIITDDEMRTNITGVFAAGDVRRKSLRQVITAAADGAVASYSAMLAMQAID